MTTQRHNDRPGVKAGVSLSIITITKDDAAGLARTLASSAVWRAYSEIEHIVVFAGEADPVMGDSRIVWRRQQSTGMAAAFNEGLAFAGGEWVWFVNGGDAVHEDLGADWLLNLLARTRAEVVTGALHFDGEAAPRALPPPAYQWPLIACWLAHPATLVRRERLLATGGFALNWRIAADYDLWFRVLAGGTMVDVVSVPFARFDVNGISERPDMAGLARREDARVVLKHSAPMIMAAARLCLRLARRIVRAAICRFVPVKVKSGAS